MTLMTKLARINDLLPEYPTADVVSADKSDEAFANGGF
jgi:hypothetical protein